MTFQECYYKSHSLFKYNGEQVRNLLCACEALPPLAE